MCDTWVAMKDATSEGRVIFAKNSDRPIFDCQPLLLHPRQHWPEGSQIHTEYLTLPQAEVTFAHLGSSPYWCWGYEEGMNEWGVVIGNEAVYTKPFQEAVQGFHQGGSVRCGLLGMDLIRIALERCQTAREAVALMGSLVEEYGQFGSGNPGRPHDQGSYDNAFIVADPNEAWVLEMAGRRWAARNMRQGYASISNELSIRSEWDLSSADLKAFAMHKGWWQETKGDASSTNAPGTTEEKLSPDFDFAHAYVDEKAARQVSHIRAMRSRQLLSERSGQVNTQWMMRIARDHYEDTFLQGPYFDAANPDFLTLCMHVSPADFTWGNTASSCIAVLPKKAGELPVMWWTPGPPCNGCYVPFFPHSSRLPETVSRAGRAGKQVVPADRVGKDTFDPDSYWWLFRALNDRVKGDAVKSLPGFYDKHHAVVRARFDALEEAFVAQLPEVMERAAAASLQGASEMAGILDAFSVSCVQQVLAALEDLLSVIPASRASSD